MIVIGVTGGIGSGKTTVTRMFGALGARTLSADAIARAVTARRTAGWRAVRRAFGPRVMTSAGEIDRRALARIVFAQPRSLARLNAIVHPRVISRMQRDIARLRRADPTGVVVVEIPLLAEAGARHLVDVVIVVEATQAQQVARVRRATGWPAADIRRRICAQWSAASKRRIADAVVKNTGARGNTRRQVRALWKTLKARQK